MNFDPQSHFHFPGGGNMRKVVRFNLNSTKQVKSIYQQLLHNKSLLNPFLCSFFINHSIKQNRIMLRIMNLQRHFHTSVFLFQKQIFFGFMFLVGLQMNQILLLHTVVLQFYIEWIYQRSLCLQSPGKYMASRKVDIIQALSDVLCYMLCVPCYNSWLLDSDTCNYAVQY